MTLRKQPQEIELAWPRLGTDLQGDLGEIVNLYIDSVAPKEKLGRPLAAGFDSIELAAGTLQEPLP